MTSLSWNQMIDSSNISLSIPDNIEEKTIVEAAVSYAKCGWYVLPIKAGTKHPGSMVGTDWPEKSTRDETEIRNTFKFPNTAIALHVGRSGAIAIDVDSPEQLSHSLADELTKEIVPFQSTRLIGDKRRGHYLFKVPIGISYGNGLGNLGTGWGDVRGHNAIIVVSPSDHCHQYGFYKWIRTGEVPIIPPFIRANLSARTGGTTSSLTRKEAQDFLLTNNAENFRSQLNVRLQYMRENLPTRNNRHTAFQRFLCGVLKDSAVGFYKASDALVETQLLFNLVKPESEQTPSEFEQMVYWAMGMVNAMTFQEKALYAYTHAPHLDTQIMKWVNNNAR